MSESLTRQGDFVLVLLSVVERGKMLAQHLCIAGWGTVLLYCMGRCVVLCCHGVADLGGVIR